MTPKLEISLPNEIYQEIEAYTRAEGMNVTEFIFWALGEKIGELRERRGVKNLTRNNIIPPPDMPKIEKVQPQLADPKRLLRAEEVAKYLRISKSTAYHLMQIREIPVVQIGKAVRVREEDLEKYVQDSRT
jgi:excisionase family DNA binding protein